MPHRLLGLFSETFITYIMNLCLRSKTVFKFRPTNNGIVIKKDEAFIKEQDKQRKAEVSNFILLKDQMLKFREEERKYRLYQKLKQIEECEALQVTFKTFLSPK
jgi:hypothetical protein